MFLGKLTNSNTWIKNQNKNIIKNKDYLSVLYKLVENSSVDNDLVKLSNEQILKLELSDKDIQNNSLISQEETDKRDLEWLKEL